MVGLTLRPSQEPVFAAIVRTTGARNHMLLAALQSLSLQSVPCLAIVVVHGSAESHAIVRQACDSAVHVLRAPDDDPARKRGFPINVGLDYCLTELPGVEYLFLLDDDDAVYPFFTSMMLEAFHHSKADVVYASSNRREPDRPLAQAYPSHPFHRLFVENFIPSNSYAIRAGALRRSGVRVDETYDYLEDWLFLLHLVENNLRLLRLEMTLSEFRAISNSDLSIRYDLALWQENAKRIRSYINSTAFPIPGADLALLEDLEPAHPAAPSVNNNLRRRVWELENSLSWKCTAPLRSLGGALLRFTRRGKARA